MRAPRDTPLLEGLLAWSPSAATPFLLDLARAQAARRRPSDLLSQRERDGLVQPCVLDQRLAHQLDGLALGAAAGFEAVLLSPVAPLGVCSALAPTSQDRTLTASRGTEVVSDPTNVLALEAARRLARDPRRDVRLCTVHQVVRTQALPRGDGFSRHFRLLALAEAGPSRAEDGFEVEAIVRHLRVFDRLFDAGAAIGCRFPGRRVTVRATPERHVLAERLCEELRRTTPHLPLAREPLEQRYYDGLRVTLAADTVRGESCPIGDLGLFDWVAKLTSNRRLRLVASGLGLQLAPLLFRET